MHSNWTATHQFPSQPTLDTNKASKDVDPYLEGLIEVLDDADRIRDEAFALLFKLHGYERCIFILFLAL